MYLNQLSETMKKTWDVSIGCCNCDVEKAVQQLILSWLVMLTFTKVLSRNLFWLRNFNCSHLSSLLLDTFSWWWMTSGWSSKTLFEPLFLGSAWWTNSVWASVSWGSTCCSVIWTISEAVHKIPLSTEGVRIQSSSQEIGFGFKYGVNLVRQKEKHPLGKWHQEKPQTHCIQYHKPSNLFT